jgi:hypothetical protein
VPRGLAESSYGRQWAAAEMPCPPTTALTLADNLRLLGRTAEAAGELETDASLATPDGERGLLLSRLLDVRPEPAYKFQGSSVPNRFRRSSSHQMQIPISEITLERRSK